MPSQNRCYESSVVCSVAGIHNYICNFSVLVDNALIAVAIFTIHKGMCMYYVVCIQ